MCISQQKYENHRDSHHGKKALTLYCPTGQYELMDALVIVFEWGNGVNPTYTEANSVILLTEAARNLLASLTSAASSARFPKINSNAPKRAAQCQLNRPTTKVTLSIDKSHQTSKKVQPNNRIAGLSIAVPQSVLLSGGDPNDKSARGGIGRYGPSHPLRNVASSTVFRPLRKKKEGGMLRRGSAWTTKSGFSPCSRASPVPLARRKLRVQPLAQCPSSTPMTMDVVRPNRDHDASPSTNLIQRPKVSIKEIALTDVDSSISRRKGSTLSPIVKSAKIRVPAFAAAGTKLQLQSSGRRFSGKIGFEGENLSGSNPLRSAKSKKSRLETPSSLIGIRHRALGETPSSSRGRLFNETPTPQKRKVSRRLHSAAAMRAFE
uniref:Uncharacterized protein n=1 Tax=Lotharella globosa TaxID=91324 RepID=A0A7S3Y7T0_9EUKA